MHACACVRVRAAPCHVRTANPNLNLAVSSYIYDREKLRHELAAAHHRPGAKTSTSLSTMMNRRRRRAIAVAVAATVCCLVLAHGGAAARPLVVAEERPAPLSSSSEAVMDVSSAAGPAAPVVRWERGDDVDDQTVLGAGKWLPLPLPLPVASALAGGLRFPPGMIPAAVGASMPWIAGAPPALAGMPLVPPYIGATRQEQLTLWASLFNPFQVRPRVPAGAGAVVESSGPAERVPAVASGGLERTSTLDEPVAGGVQIGEPKWGVFLGTPNNG